MADKRRVAAGRHAPRVPNGGSIVRSPTPCPTLLASFRVQDHEGRPIAGAEADIWHASPVGLRENQDPEQAERERKVIPQLSRTFPATELEDAYAIQGLWAQARAAQGAAGPAPRWRRTASSRKPASRPRSWATRPPASRGSSTSWRLRAPGVSFV